MFKIKVVQLRFMLCWFFVRWAWTIPQLFTDPKKACYWGQKYSI